MLHINWLIVFRCRVFDTEAVATLCSFLCVYNLSFFDLSLPFPQLLLSFVISVLSFWWTFRQRTLKPAAVILKGVENILTVWVDKIRPGFPQRMDDVIDEADLTTTVTYIT